MGLVPTVDSLILEAVETHGNSLELSDVEEEENSSSVGLVNRQQSLESGGFVDAREDEEVDGDDQRAGPAALGVIKSFMGLFGNS